MSQQNSIPLHTRQRSTKHQSTKSEKPPKSSADLIGTKTRSRTQNEVAKHPPVKKSKVQGSTSPSHQSNQSKTDASNVITLKECSKKSKISASVTATATKKELNRSSVVLPRRPNSKVSFPAIRSEFQDVEFNNQPNILSPDIVDQKAQGDKHDITKPVVEKEWLKSELKTNQSNEEASAIQDDIHPLAIVKQITEEGEEKCDGFDDLLNENNCTKRPAMEITKILPLVTVKKTEVASTSKTVLQKKKPLKITEIVDIVSDVSSSDDDSNIPKAKTNFYAQPIGIDLGTTNSCVAFYNGNKSETITNRLGLLTTPSYVSFCKTDGLIGTAAKKQMANNPFHYDMKRIIGRRFDDEVVQSAIEKSNWQFKVKEGKNGMPVIDIKYMEKTFTVSPIIISAMILGELKKCAEAKFGNKQIVRDVVITVPANFRDAQRTSTILAAKIAGLHCNDIINEPTAAAIKFGLDSFTDGKKRLVMVIDMGGGTLDATILSIDGKMFTCICSAGDAHLGGQDFDNCLLTHFMEQIKKSNEDFVFDARKISQLRSKCEELKNDLTSVKSATLHISSFLSPTEDFIVEITRNEFDRMARNLYARILQVIKDVLIEAKKTTNEIDEVVMVGGGSRIPKVFDIVKRFMGKQVLNESLNADQDIAHGAAIFAATQGNIRYEKLENFLLNEVSTYSLGVQIDREMIDVIIPKNQQIPTTVQNEYTTQSADDDYVDIRVYEIINKDSLLCKNNRLIGQFRLNDIKAAKTQAGHPARKPLIDVTFNMNASGSLLVSAKDRYGAAEDNIDIQINTPTHIDSNEIKLMENQYIEIMGFRESQTKLQELWCNIDEKVNSSDKSLKKYQGILKAVNDARGCWLNVKSIKDCYLKQKELKKLCETAGLDCK